MARTRRLRAVVSASLLAVMVVAGCGSGADAEKQEIISGFVSELEMDGALPEEEKDCLVAKFDQFSVEELRALKNSTAQEEVSEDLQDKLVELVQQCFMSGASQAP